MKRLFNNIRRQKEKWILHKADLTEQAIPLHNPARGWYQIYTFQAQKEPDFQELAYSLEINHTLAMVFVDIGYYQCMDMDSDALTNIRNTIRFFADNHKDVILRAAYDNQGKAMEREPSSFEQILRHMSQIGEVLSGFPNEIPVYQGLLVGSWGEMHTSRFISEDKLRQLMDILYGKKGIGTYPSVRRPVHLRMLKQYGKYSGLGLFDDGIFGSPSNLGTFGTYTREAAGPGGAWSREEELEFEEELCRSVPNGGEAVFGEDYTDKLSPSRIIADLRRMHISYLNSRHDMKLLEMWKNCRAGAEGLWAEKSLYDYIGAHMGYRFILKDASLTPVENGCGNRYRLELIIENSGFGSLYQEAELFLEWTDEDGRFNRRKLSCDMREWNSGGTYTASCVIEACEGSLYLSARRKWDNAPIRFANIADDKGRTIIGSMCRQAL